MALIAKLACLLLLVLGGVDAISSILDLPQCNTAAVVKDINISPQNPLITKTSESRSAVECAVNCMRSFPVKCNSVLRDETSGKCYELNGDPTGTEVSANQTYYMEGCYMEFMTQGEHENCNGRTCRDNEVCMKSCVDGEPNSPICLADQSDECSATRQNTNLRYYWSDVLSQAKESGVLLMITYPKSRNESGLRVVMQMVIAPHRNEAQRCSLWYITFDGKKCGNPGSIEYLDYNEVALNEFRPMDIDGTCYDLGVGEIKIELVVTACQGFANSDTNTGWNSARTMVVMEVLPLPLSSGMSNDCPLLNDFNYKYQIWNEVDEVTFDLRQGGRLLKSVTYDKLADDTSLHIKYSAVASVVILDSSLIHCARWYVTVDGVECSPQLDFVLSQFSTNRYLYWRYHRRTRTAEGICDNSLNAGTHTISIFVGECEGVSGHQPTKVITGGYNSPSRLHVTEVRRDHAVDGVKTRAEMYRSHSGNIERYHWWKPDSEEDNGDLFSITYVKEYADTGLRMTASGTHKIYVTSGYSNCGRWYFKIDDQECSNPGKIEGLIYFDKLTHYYSPMQVSGMCQDVTAGTHTVVYAVGVCNGYGVTEARTGWASSFHVIIEELRFDLVKTCSTSDPITCGI